MSLFFKLKSAIFLAADCFTKKSSMRKLLIFTGAWFLVSFVFAQNNLSQQQAERLFNSGVDLVNHNQYGAAREVFGEYLTVAAATDARRADAEYYKAFCSLNLYHSDAEKQIESFIVKNPTHPRAGTANYDLANFYYAEKNYKKAASFYNKIEFGALAQDQQRTAHFRWGYSHFNQRSLKKH
jgi:TolA-binding protein